jgi:glycine oxidase
LSAPFWRFDVCGAKSGPVARSPSPPTVLIVGAGIMGTSIALELARRGHQVTLLEKAIPGAEASSAAAGILGAEVENETAGPLLDLCRVGRDAFGPWVRELERQTGVDTDFGEAGSVEVFSDEAKAVERSLRRSFQLESGPSRRVSGAELTALEPALGSSFRDGIFFPGDAHVDPRQLYRATRLAAEQAQVHIETGVLVRSLKVEAGDGQRVCRGVVLDDGSELHADTTITCAGSWTRFVEGLGLQEDAVIPARGQVIELRCGEPVLRRVVFGAGIYLVPRRDGRVLVGSTLEFVGYQKAVTAGGISSLLAAALKLVPELQSAELSGMWSNFRPYTHDQRPLIGDVGISGLWVASGHYRMGILLGPITAQIVADLVASGKTKLDLGPFHPLRFKATLPPPALD